MQLFNDSARAADEAATYTQPYPKTPVLIPPGRVRPSEAPQHEYKYCFTTHVIHPFQRNEE